MNLSGAVKQFTTFFCFGDVGSDDGRLDASSDGRLDASKIPKNTKIFIEVQFSLYATLISCPGSQSGQKSGIIQADARQIPAKIPGVIKR